MFNAIVTVIGVAVTGLIGWGSKLQSDVRVQDQKVVDLKDLINEKLETNNVKLDNIDHRLERIERALNGSLRSVYGDSRYDHH